MKRSIASPSEVITVITVIKNSTVKDRVAERSRTAVCGLIFDWRVDAWRRYPGTLSQKSHRWFVANCCSVIGLKFAPTFSDIRVWSWFH